MRFYVPKWAIALLCPLAIAAAIHLNSTRHFIDLFPYQLNDSDLHKVMARLDELGYRYVFDETTRNLRVAPDQQAQIRAQLALVHLPVHRLLDKDSRPQQQGWAPLSESQKPLWDRLVSEGELVQAVRGVEGVEDAWVLLDDQKVSVLVQLTQPLDQPRLDLVLALIAKGSGFERDAIELHDTDGGVLWP